MRAYSVNDDSWGMDGPIGNIVWADRKTQAASVFLSAYDYAGEFLDAEQPLRVEDVTAAVAGYAPQKAEPHVDYRKAVERRAGFRYEGDRECDTCGLFECEAAFPVCEDCGQCVECGCDCDGIDSVTAD